MRALIIDNRVYNILKEDSPFYTTPPETMIPKPDSIIYIPEEWGPYIFSVMDKLICVNGSWSKESEVIILEEAKKRKTNEILELITKSDTDSIRPLRSIIFRLLTKKGLESDAHRNDCAKLLLLEQKVMKARQNLRKVLSVSNIKEIKSI